jgi:hypothetical protein
LFYKNLFYICKKCKGIFRSKSQYLSRTEEKECYLNHENDVTDPNYQKFVSPITNSILDNQKPFELGLDFGAGTGPVISYILKKNNYNIKQYDPYFHKYPKLLQKQYKYLACCEVIEHFHQPREEFRLLKQLLKNGGHLYAMSELYNSNINFKTWQYRRQPTHVFIYQKQTLQWIQKHFKFTNLTIDGRLIIFTK